MPSPFPCGTYAAYMRHQKAGETPCTECHTAARIYWRDKERRRNGSPASTATVACRRCGEVFTRQLRRGRPRVYCPPCSLMPETRRPGESTRRLQALKALPPDQRPQCSVDGCDGVVRGRGMCGSHYSSWRRAKFGRTYKRRLAVCEFCSKDFSTTGKASHCSVSCGLRHRNGWSPGPPPVPPAPPPRSAAVEIYTGPRRRRVFEMVVATSGRTYVAGSCRRCNKAFVIIDQLTNSYCSKQCGTADGRARRRARKRDGYVADVRRQQIFERDRWRCQLCRKPVARTKQVPHPKAPVLDHIIPLAKGGTHEPKNVQCAHHLCNCRKSDRATNDQLRLL